MKRIVYKKDKTKYREAKKEKIFKRDNYECIICGETRNLQAHHVTDKEQVTLCQCCHNTLHNTHYNKKYTRYCIEYLLEL